MRPRLRGHQRHGGSHHEQGMVCRLFQKKKQRSRHSSHFSTQRTGLQGRKNLAGRFFVKNGV